MNRNTIAAKKIRETLLDRLGPFCVLCGEEDREKLEFDHRFGRGYVPSKLSYRGRMIRYREEAAKGLIRVLCGPCNLKERKTNDAGQHVPAASVLPKTVDLPY
jgi:hypothetical protein